MAVIVSGPNTWRIEYPMGTVRAEGPGFGSLRISPDGTQIAFISYSGGGDDGAVEVMGKDGKRHVLAAGFNSVAGLAWRHDGREIWFTGTEAGALRSLRGVTLDGKQRVIYHGSSGLQLEDIAPDGRALLSARTLESEVHFASVSQKTDRDLSWFDFGGSASLSADASMIAFQESGEGAGSKYGVFVRPTSGDPATRIADGQVAQIAPDGKHVAIYDPATRILNVVPTGAGETKTITGAQLETISSAHWFPDSRRLAIVAKESGHRFRTFSVDTAAGTITPLTPEGVAGSYVSPDEHWLLIGGPSQPRRLYDLRAKATAPFPGAERPDPAIGWAPDSRAVFFARRDDVVLELIRIEIATGARTDLGPIGAGVGRSGTVQFAHPEMAADGDHYAYTVVRDLSELYLIKVDG